MQHFILQTYAYSGADVLFLEAVSENGDYKNFIVQHKIKELVLDD